MRGHFADLLGVLCPFTGSTSVHYTVFSVCIRDKNKMFDFLSNCVVSGVEHGFGRACNCGQLPV